MAKKGGSKARTSMKTVMRSRKKQPSMKKNRFERNGFKEPTQMNEVASLLPLEKKPKVPTKKSATMATADLAAV